MTSSPVAWKQGEIWFLKPGYSWVDPKWGFRLGYIYGTPKQLTERLQQVEKIDV